MIKNCLIIVLTFLLLILHSACTKKEVQYWPPSKYGEKLKKSEEHFRRGKKEGVSTWWYPNGNIQLESYYKEGKLNGVLKRWHYNGNMDRMDHYLNNVLHGNSKTFFQNGLPESDVNYTYGVLDGKYSTYWESGEPNSVGEYNNGFYHGKWIFYNQNGIKIAEANFNRGDGLKTEYSLKTAKKIKETPYKRNKIDGIEIWWDESGNIIKKIYYKDDKIAEIKIIQ